VRAVAARLAGHVGVCQLVWTISVCPDFERSGIDEDSPRATLRDREVQVVDGGTCGDLKALREDAAPGDVRRALADRPARVAGRPARPDRTLHLVGVPRGRRAVVSAAGPDAGRHRGVGGRRRGQG